MSAKNTLLNYFTRTVSVGAKGKCSQTESMKSDSNTNESEIEKKNEDPESPVDSKRKNPLSCKKRGFRETLEQFSPILEKKPKIEGIFLS